MYDILEGGCCAHPKLPGPTPHYSTVRAHHRDVGPESGDRVSLTRNTANAGHHGGEGVVGGFAAERRLSEAPVAAAEY